MAAGIKRWLRWGAMLAPHGAWQLVEKLKIYRQFREIPWSLLQSNVTLASSRLNERCFILGNGPSVKDLDLSPLVGEAVFSVSNGYLHTDYGSIKPQFHCVPQITYGRMTEDDVIGWFEEMHACIGDAVLFLSTSEADLVKQHNLFPGRKIHYLALRESFDYLSSNQVIDLSGPAPGVESVPVMAIMVALYMGFNEIYLLGVDHDHFKTRTYNYAFDLGVQKNKDFSVAKDGIVVTNYHDEFQSLARLWRQYRALRKIADHNGIQILNATPGGELDEFPRVPFNQVTEGKI